MTKSINERASDDVGLVTTSTILDDSDFEIIKLLVAGHNNQQIANETKIPLSTVQRKTRIMFEKGYVISRNEIDYKRLGYKRGLIHIYLEHGDLKQIAKRVTKMDSVQTVSLHAGNLPFFYFELMEGVNNSNNNPYLDPSFSFTTQARRYFSALSESQS